MVAMFEKISKKFRKIKLEYIAFCIPLIIYRIVCPITVKRRFNITFSSLGSTWNLTTKEKTRYTLYDRHVKLVPEHESDNNFHNTTTTVKNVIVLYLTVVWNI